MNRILFLLVWTVLGAVSPAQSTARGRDPWAFRLTLESKTRMLVVALRSDLWLAYNPANGALHKVWASGVWFRGKVYDFSQENSTTQGEVYHQQKNSILSATTESSIPPGWSATSVTPGPSDWTFSAAGASLTTPILDFTGYQNVMLFFREQDPGPLSIEVSDNGGATWVAQAFRSTQPGNPVQENAKLIAASGSNARLRFARPSGTGSKRLRDVVMIGDYQVWTASKNGGTIQPQVDWRGYRITGRTESITVKYDLALPGGERVRIEESPEAMVGAALTRRFRCTGLPPGVTISLRIKAASSGVYTERWSVSGNGALRQVAGDAFLDITADGEATLNTTWSR